MLGQQRDHLPQRRVADLAPHHADHVVCRLSVQGGAEGGLGGQDVAQCIDDARLLLSGDVDQDDFRARGTPFHEKKRILTTFSDHRAQAALCRSGGGRYTARQLHGQRAALSEPAYASQNRQLLPADLPSRASPSSAAGFAHRVHQHRAGCHRPGDLRLRDGSAVQAGHARASRCGGPEPDHADGHVRHRAAGVQRHPQPQRAAQQPGEKPTGGARGDLQPGQPHPCRSRSAPQKRPARAKPGAVRDQDQLPGRPLPDSCASAWT